MLFYTVLMAELRINILNNSCFFKNQRLLAMINALKQLIFPVDSGTQAVYAYLRLLGVPVTTTGLATLLLEHPDTGALLSVSDALTSLGIENAVAKVSAGQLDRLEIPFIARLKAGDGLSLAVVKRFDEDAVRKQAKKPQLLPGSSRGKGLAHQSRPNLNESQPYGIFIKTESKGSVVKSK